MGVAPFTTSALMTLRCTFRGRMILSPFLQAVSTIVCTDDVVPPTTAFATYNSVTAPKEVHPYQQTAHFWYQEQWDEWNAWICRQMGVKF